MRWGTPSFTAVQAQRRIESFFGKGKYQKRYKFVPLDQAPMDVYRAVIAAEDGRFYEHHGIDWEEMKKAFGENRATARGASTITQQLVKSLFLTTHRSVLRKAVAYTLAPLAELILPKKRILELYLNVIEWDPVSMGYKQPRSITTGFRLQG